MTTEAEAQYVASAGTSYDDTCGLLRPPVGAVGLSAIRAVGPTGVMRQYSAVEFRRGWHGVEHFIRTLRAVGYVRPSTETGYARSSTSWTRKGTSSATTRSRPPVRSRSCNGSSA